MASADVRGGGKLRDEQKECLRRKLTHRMSFAHSYLILSTQSKRKETNYLKLITKNLTRTIITSSGHAISGVFRVPSSFTPRSGAPPDQVLCKSTAFRTCFLVG